MAKKPIKTKISPNGKAITLVMSPERLEAILANLGACDERDQLVESMAEANERAEHLAREVRLATPLSIESLTPLGWMLTGDYTPKAFGAIREGDFRFDERDGQSGWVYGPPGAFDREPTNVKVMRGATQAAVMSEVHHIYRLMDPSMDRPAAIAQANNLERQWTEQLPVKRRPPNGAAKALNKQYWSHYMNASDFEHLPEGATICRGPYGISPLTLARPTTEKVYESDGKTVGIVSGDALLGPVISMPYARDAVVTTVGFDWGLGNRHYDQYFDGQTDRRDVLKGPYHCVLGNVWGALYFDSNSRTVNLNMLRTGGGGSSDTRNAQCFPLASKEEAEAAAKRYAVELGISEEKAPEAPIPLPVPDFKGADILEDVA